MSSFTVRPTVRFAPLPSDEEIVDASAGHGGFRVRRATGTAGRGTLATTGTRLRAPQSVADMFQPARVAGGANGASGANGANGAGVGVDTVLQEAAAAAAAGGGSSYYPSSVPSDAMTIPMEVPPLDELMQGIDVEMVSGDIEEPQEGIMGFVEKNPMAAAAIAGVVGFLGYRYAKQRGMI